MPSSGSWTLAYVPSASPLSPYMAPALSSLCIVNDSERDWEVLERKLDSYISIDMVLHDTCIFIWNDNDNCVE
jgi:hypothetical protein